MIVFTFIILIVLLSFIGFKLLIGHVTVREYERAVFFRYGKIKRLLDEGRFYFFRFGAEVNIFDLRKQISTVRDQELLTKDNVGVKLTLSIAYRIEDVKKLLLATQNHSETLHTLAQLSLRSLISRIEVEKLVENRNAISKELLEMVETGASSFGVKVEFAELKDFMYASELRRIFSEVLRAKQEGKAVLEKAHAEMAAVRTLANAARVMKDNKEIFQLKLLHVMSSTTGNTYVIGNEVAR